jgi:hypothetical protein
MFLSGFFLGALLKYIEILPNCSEHLPRTPSNLVFFVITTQADAGPNRPNPALALRLSMVIPVLMPSGA